MASINRYWPAEVCDPSSPYWMAVKSGNPAYTFCAKQDLEFVAGWPPVVNVNKYENKDLTLKWNILEPVGFAEDRSRYSTMWHGGQSGTGEILVDGNDGGNDHIYALNANEFGYGGFKIMLCS
ncbi:MAG: hypothetical protein IPO29_09885 [Anaerolineae bacterium]|nr:hypothetical protein [Anaerolineae bacterium]